MRVRGTWVDIECVQPGCLGITVTPALPSIAESIFPGGLSTALLQACNQNSRMAI